MRILILGAGGIGGYFGAQIQRAGGDVTYLVRPARAQNLIANGLYVSSTLGDIHVTPRVVTSIETPCEAFDLIIITCKAYDFDSALASILPAIGGNSLILPLLNGVAHLDTLDALFGRERVLGGLAHLAVTLTPSGEIKHLNSINRLIIGSRCTSFSKQVSSLAELLSSTSIDFSLSSHIEQDMWNKFIFLCTMAGATCTMRANIGEILSTVAGESFITGLLDECERVATANHRIPNPDQLLTYRNQLTEQGSSSTASMLRDIERGGPIEAEHTVGDMVRRADASGISVPLLKLAYSHLQAYELTRQRHGY
ncbi:MAG: ketopantoate reductase family protein [Methylobacter sp.]|nr:ketopantoate reductase family protein [Methylobacter sp.]